MFLQLWAADTEPVQLNLLDFPPDRRCKYTDLVHLYSSQDDDFSRKQYLMVK